jgi:uncharacterized pyridoxal phosphate-containing UPF0001 family protein
MEKSSKRDAEGLAARLEAVERVVGGGWRVAGEGSEGKNIEAVAREDSPPNPPAGGGDKIESASGEGLLDSPSYPTLDSRLSTLSSPATLIAVTKTHPVSVIEEAIALGVTDFGENKVQEAAMKYPAIKAKYPHIKLHLIGGLQTNKVKEALALFDVIHTIDRPRLVDAIMKEVAGGGWQVAGEEWRVASDKWQVRSEAPATNQPSPVTCHLPPATLASPPAFLIQVNTGAEAQKGGVSPAELPALLDYCKMKGLPISGLMCIPPANEPPAPHFALLQKLAARHGLKELSMGMSGDYHTALRFGATMIRLGTALFGAREV